MADDLYRRVILERYQSPAHRGAVVEPNVTAEAHNPLCGDELALSARIEGDMIVDVSWDGLGCSILYASADLMADAILGRTVADAEILIDQVWHMLGSTEGPTPDFGELAVLAGVQRYPSRVRCAQLPWKTLGEALNRRAVEGDSAARGS